jgi:hypothetical protein
MAVAVPFPVSVFVSVVVSVIVPMSLPIARGIHVVIPVVAYEIDRYPTGVILGAMLVPVFRMAGRYMEIDRGLGRSAGKRPDHHGLGVNDLGPRKAADIDLTIKTGLADPDRHADVGRLGGGNPEGKNGKQ